ncbi:hypothetical protein BIS47_28 [Klebsiella phage vB_KpnM_BIS47]|uniref:Uncharacterized protein n=1 Tax=Klebsiella phage vB_KpnM_BIS47 TaxID=1907784 RepID=A0A1V0E6L3_9CAUD|nr:hypothetical protein BIS47_28 [Klebsiella phage vB_KpnM_BIS47]ARB12532.1 hypothetical protein BIS47_28 [Klebsiella phage vB_KpnM_BIS47]
MSFTLNKQFNTFKQIPGLGITCPAEVENIEVTYTVVGITDIRGNSATVTYTTSVQGVEQTGNGLFSFEFIDLSNIISEAERALQVYLS